MDAISLTGLAISPAIAMVIIIYQGVTHKHVSLKSLINSFLLGGLSSFLVIIGIALSIKYGLQFSSDLYALLFFSFLVVGLLSEIGKFIVLKLFVLTDAKLKTPVHGILYTVTTSLGFSTMLALVMLFKPFHLTLPYALNMFLYLVGPANICFGVILGFFLGMVKFVDKPWVYNFSGLVCSIFFAGLFSFCMVTRDFKLLSLFAFGSSIVTMVFIFRAVYFKP